MDDNIRKYFSELGKKAAVTNKAKGKEYFSDLGKKSAEKRRARKLDAQ